MILLNNGLDLLINETEMSLKKVLRIYWITCFLSFNLVLVSPKVYHKNETRNDNGFNAFGYENEQVYQIYWSKKSLENHMGYILIERKLRQFSFFFIPKTLIHLRTIKQTIKKQSRKYFCMNHLQGFCSSVV